MVVLASDHDAETDRLQRHLDSRNEQIDGYERQLGIDKAGAEHTIGSEIEQLRGNLSLAEEGLANYALEVERKNSLIDLQDEAQTSLHAENVRLREETERLLNIITGCPVCSELERNIQPSHEPSEQLCGCGEFCNQSIGSPFKGQCRRAAHGLPVKSGVCVCGDSSLPGTHRTDGPCHQ